MKNDTTGSTTVTALLVALGVIALGGAAYMAVKHGRSVEPATEAVQDNGQNAPVATEDRVAKTPTGQKDAITWRFSEAGEKEGIPQTRVVVTVNGAANDMGTFDGSCSEVGAGGGIDGKGLLTGEIAAAQCWFAGGGSEIGVFGHEDGGYEIMVGELSEGAEGAGMFRGNFVIKKTIRF